VEAGTAAAEARRAEAEAEYLQRGLAAFREVEDALVELRELAEQAAAQSRAAAAADELLRLAVARYEGGFAGYLEVLEARAARQRIERIQIELAGARLNGTVRLIRALGGGW
jgi:multidrug efflux system outer membrane protein